MNVSDNRRDLKALHNFIDQADLVLNTIPNPHPSIHSARESLNAALALSKELLDRDTDGSVKSSAASLLGAKGGQATAKRGPEYFRELAAKRKNRGGGKPKNSSNTET